jgi:hypothetical protein
MEEVFKSFCAFGAGKEGTALMDNSKFAKLARDLKLLDMKLTATDIDIIFNRTEVKPKSERKITYQHFKSAVKLMAEKKYPGDADGVKKLEAKIAAGKPKVKNTTKAVKAGAVDRLTDTTKYTGSHKERFDDSGKGKGLDGRREMDTKADSGYVGGYQGMETYDKTH